MMMVKSLAQNAGAGGHVLFLFLRVIALPANRCVENMMIVESTAQNARGCLRLDDG